MNNRINLTLFILAAFFAACQSTQQEYTPITYLSSEKAQPFISKTDIAAIEVLQEASQNPHRTYRIEEYSKKAHYMEDGKISVDYKLETSHVFRGHPSHFSIWINPETEELQVFKGR